MKPAWHALIHRARQIPYLSGLPKLLAIRALLADCRKLLQGGAA